MTKLAPDRPNLMWLEDRESTAQVELQVARQRAVEVHLRASPVELMARLGEAFGDAPPHEDITPYRVGFVIDIMLVGLRDLSALGVRHSDTNGGMSAGYIFVDRVLRAINSPYCFCPVCFLSERVMTPDLLEDIEYLRERKDATGKEQGSITYVRKFSLTELLKSEEFLETL